MEVIYFCCFETFLILRYTIIILSDYNFITAFCCISAFIKSVGSICIFLVEQLGPGRLKDVQGHCYCSPGPVVDSRSQLLPREGFNL